MKEIKTSFYQLPDESILEMLWNLIIKEASFVHQLRDGTKSIIPDYVSYDLKIEPLSPTIAYESTVLPPPFHNDPADQIIVATARAENAIVITKDKLLHDYPHVNCLW